MDLEVPRSIRGGGTIFLDLPRLTGRPAIEHFKDMSAARQSGELIGLVLVVGLQSLFLHDFGVRNLALALLFFAITMAICVAGFRTGRFRGFWVVWSVLSIVGLVMLGMPSPISGVPAALSLIPFYVS